MRPKLPDKGTPVEIRGRGVYINQMQLFKNYCKILVNGGYVILPIEMITKEKEDVNINKTHR